MPRTVLVTGAAGFIGFQTALRLLRRRDRVGGLDNLNDYYDVAIKEPRLRLLDEHPDFSTVRRPW
jgi:UDP-glucuronate 4-epimerase